MFFPSSVTAMFPWFKPAPPPTSAPAPRCRTPPPESQPASAVPSTPKTPSASRGDSTSWELLSAPSMLVTSRSPTPAPTPSENTPFDTDTFPDHAYMFPSEPNGTWRNNSLQALKHLTALSSKLHELAESTSEDISTRINRACESQDVSALHDCIMNMFPSVSMPNVRQLDQVLNSWAFARLMGVKALRIAVRQRIYWDWQVTPSQLNSRWQFQLSNALSATFEREKVSFGIAELFEMSPLWTADRAGRCWRLQLDTGLTDVVVEEEGGRPTEESIRLGVDFELPESSGCQALEDVKK
ncbi:hypothetical protein EJ02DRAFT_514434 [Clathrospora elynae]|uniref:Uncharacterized protein n=1 Tax=Clathrospora elynae TaxID=706981 RepID=A0A6A5SGQ6_9PLEO|nr:hypothetical protein EJ02DRAFT_514434 [Clathrospora elynae]